MSQLSLEPIERVLRRARGRLWVSFFINSLCLAAIFAIALAGLLRLGEQLVGLAIDWQSAAIAIGSAALALALLRSILLTPRSMSLARIVDERANLRQSFSTAMSVARTNPEDAWARVVVEDARSLAPRVDLASALPWQAPPRWHWAAGGAVGLLIVFIAMPKLDLLGRAAQRQTQARQTQEAVKVREQIKQDQEQLRELLAKANVDAKSADDLVSQAAAPQGEKPEEIRRAEIKRLTSLSERLKQLSDGEKAQQLKALEQAAQKLKVPGRGPMEQMARSMAKGEFGKAKDQLEQLQRSLGDGSMSQEQKEQLAKQLEQMSTQMAELAKDNKELAQKLAQAGMDPAKAAELASKLASDPQALQQAAEALKNLSPEQRQSLINQAKSLMEANSKMQQMAQAMQQGAQQMNQQGGGEQGQQGGEAMNQLAQSLSEMEQMQSEQQAVDAALQTAQSQMDKLGEGEGQGEGQGQGGMAGLTGNEGPAGEWKPGQSQGSGSGTGGPGHGSGASPPEEAADFLIKKEKANVETTQGQIIGSRLIYGEQIRGESVAAFSEATEAGARQAAEAMQNMEIPRQYHDAVKAYFGTLEQNAKDAQRTAPPAAPAPPPAEKK